VCEFSARLNAARIGEIVEHTDDNETSRSWLMSVLTDIQFWVPVAVLIGGLLLLRSLH